MPINQRDIPHQQKKRQNHMIVSIDGEKAFDKIQHPFMIKKSYQSGDRRNIYQINKSYFMTNSQLNSEKLKILPAKIRNKTKPLSPFLVNRVLKILATGIRQERKIKDTQNGREEAKLSLYADDMILYIENPKDFTQNLLELLNEFSKVAKS